MEVDCGFQAVDFGGLVVDSGWFRLIAVDSGWLRFSGRPEVRGLLLRSREMLLSSFTVLCIVKI